MNLVSDADVEYSHLNNRVFSPCDLQENNDSETFKEGTKL